MRPRRLELVLFLMVTVPIGLAMAQSEPSSAETSTAASASNSAISAPPIERPPEQLVWLHSGAVLRGAIIELVPGKTITLQLATGEIRQIAWDEIRQHQWVEASASATPSTPPVFSSPPAVTRSGVLIHLLGDHPHLRLETQPLQGGPWRFACDAPCNQSLTVYQKNLRVTGPGIRPSNPFAIDAQQGEESLQVNAGSETSHVWGQRSLTAGIVLALAGGLAYGLGRLEDSDEATLGGITFMSLGGLGILVSLPLLGTSTTTVRNGKGNRVGLGETPHRW